MLVDCKNCGRPRSKDLRKACDQCRSKQYWELGNVYSYEAWSVGVRFVVVLLVAIAAVARGLQLLADLNLRMSMLP